MTAAVLVLGACSPAVIQSGASSSSQGPAGPPTPRPVDLRRVVLSYQAPASCPGSDGYVRHVSDRSAMLLVDPLPLAEPTPDRVRIRIVPERGGSGWIGQLSIVGPAALEREVRGERCQDVVAALALITVLRLEGQDSAATASLPPPPEAAASAETALATPQPQNSEQKGEPELASPRRQATENAEMKVEPPGPEGEVSPETRLEPSPPTEPSEPSQSAARASIDTPSLAAPEPPRVLPDGAASVTEAAPFAAEEGDESERPDRTDESERSDVDAAPLQTILVGQVGYASVPSHAFKVALQAELRSGQALASWAGAFGIGFAHGSDSGPFGSVALSLFTAELALCPPGASDPRVWLQACMHLRAGALALSLAAGERALSTEDVVRPWAALGPSLQLGFPLSRTWALRTQAELLVQLVQDRFEGERAELDANGEPERFTLYRPEAVSFELAVGLGYAF